MKNLLQIFILLILISSCARPIRDMDYLYNSPDYTETYKDEIRIYNEFGVDSLRKYNDHFWITPWMLDTLRLDSLYITDKRLEKKLREFVRPGAVDRGYIFLVNQGYYKLEIELSLLASWHFSIITDNVIGYFKLNGAIVFVQSGYGQYKDSQWFKKSGEENYLLNPYKDPLPCFDFKIKGIFDGGYPIGEIRYNREDDLFRYMVIRNYKSKGEKFKRIKARGTLMTKIFGYPILL